MYRIIIWGIMLFFMARLLYLYIAGWVRGSVLKLKDALSALLYLFLAALALYFRYQGNFWKKAIVFSFANWKDVVFLIMYTIPIVLTIADVVLARKYDKKEKK